MTKEETVSYLENLDEYFQIHGWCTQMDEKISSFMDRLNSKDRSHVKEWAYATLAKNNSKSASHIMAIIFLKLLATADRELIHILYTVLSGRLTFEDFSSLNTYIFKGKPPLTKNLFYNITERVFIDTKSALKKALSISSIISEADPELTIFYMTMLLCRVDLNNENRAMLNFLLYCIDADIPDEVSKGVREYLLSIIDVIEDIFTSENNSETKRILETVYSHIEEETQFPGIITIEKTKPPEQKEKLKAALSQKASPIFKEQENDSPVLKSSKKPREETTSPYIINTSQRGAATPFQKLQDEITQASRSPLKHKEKSKRQDTSAIREEQKRENRNIRFPESNSIAAESENGKPLQTEKHEIPEIKGNKGNLNQQPPSEKQYGNPAQRVSQQPLQNRKEKTSLEKDISYPLKEYELKLKKFKLSDLLIFKKKNKTKNKTTSTESAIETNSHSKTTSLKGPFRYRNIWLVVAALIVIVTAGLFLLHQGTKTTSAPVSVVKETNGKSTGSQSTHGAILQPQHQQQNQLPGSQKIPTAQQSGTEKQQPSAQTPFPRAVSASGNQWKLEKNENGIQWTVQKGESVWKLYIYLQSHSDDLTGPLKTAGEMDWLPFIQQVITLNPWKHFADPIEPGEVFFISRK